MSFSRIYEKRAKKNWVILEERKVYCLTRFAQKFTGGTDVRIVQTFDTKKTCENMRDVLNREVNSILNDCIGLKVQYACITQKVKSI